MSAPRTTLAPLMGTERVACVLRMVVGLLTLLMTVQFEPLASWLAVAATVTPVGWLPPPATSGSTAWSPACR